jgi:uncharacterized protein (TIGR00251 family)
MFGLSVYVQPNAGRNAFAGLHGGSLKVRIAAPAIDGKANVLPFDFLGESLDVPAGRVMIRRGDPARTKTIGIRAPGAAMLGRVARLVDQ